MKDKVLKYFGAEKFEGVLGTIIGLLSIGLGITFLVGESEFARGTGYPLILFGLLEVIIFLTVVIRTPKDIKRVLGWVQSGDLKLRSVEIPRMKKVMRNFVYYRWTEIAFLIIGIVIFFVLNVEFWKGVGTGIAIHSALLLIMDGFAEKRGREFLDLLETF